MSTRSTRGRRNGAGAQQAEKDHANKPAQPRIQRSPPLCAGAAPYPAIEQPSAAHEPSRTHQPRPPAANQQRLGAAEQAGGGRDGHGERGADEHAR